MESNIEISVVVLEIYENRSSAVKEDCIDIIDSSFAHVDNDVNHEEVEECVTVRVQTVVGMWREDLCWSRLEILGKIGTRDIGVAVYHREGIVEKSHVDLIGTIDAREANSIPSEPYRDHMNSHIQEGEGEGIGDVYDACIVIQICNQEEITGLGDVDAHIHHEVIEQPVWR